MLVCLLLRELRDAPNIRVSPIVSELSDTPPLTWLCHAIMRSVFLLDISLAHTTASAIVRVCLHCDFPMGN